MIFPTPLQFAALQGPLGLPRQSCVPGLCTALLGLGTSAADSEAARCGQMLLWEAPIWVANTALECHTMACVGSREGCRRKKPTDVHKKMMSRLGSPLLRVVWAGRAFKRSLCPVKPPPALGTGMACAPWHPEHQHRALRSCLGLDLGLLDSLIHWMSP